jgi:mannitol-specific phosphotransferase system IIBC component
VEIPRHFKLYQAACKNEVGSSGLLHVLVAAVVLGHYREQSEREGKKVGKKKKKKKRKEQTKRKQQKKDQKNEEEEVPMRPVRTVVGCLHS